VTELPGHYSESAIRLSLLK